MSYDIYIGQRVKDKTWGYRVNDREREEAPCFDGDSMTGHGNHRHPAYSSWSRFCEETGLDDLFFNDTHGLMREHPGCVTLLPSHLTQVQEALAEWTQVHTQAPGWGPNQDPMTARLIWLEWWMAWALKHCTEPAIFNC